MEGFKIIKLKEEDKKALLELSKTITDNLSNKMWYITYNQDEIAHMFEDDYGIYLGAFVKDKLVAVSSIYLDSDYTKLVKEHINVKGKLAEIGHCMVLPEYRGNNLMFELNKKILEIAKDKKVDYINFTVHPDNIASYSSMGKLGAERKATYVRDKIYPRCIYLLKV